MSFLNGLYGISDSAFGDPVTLGQALLEAHPCALQLRCKTWPLARIEAVLRTLHPLCKEKGVPLIVNDHPALAALADGLHLGQDDGPIDRSRLPDHCIVGRSTHNIEQALEAVSEGADYLGFGPLFVTKTKSTGYTARGLESLREVVSAVEVPVVAIEGVAPEHIHNIQETGAAAWAPISSILADKDPGLKAQMFRRFASDTPPGHLPQAESRSATQGVRESGG